MVFGYSKSTISFLWIKFAALNWNYAGWNYAPATQPLQSKDVKCMYFSVEGEITYSDSLYQSGFGIRSILYS